MIDEVDDIPTFAKRIKTKYPVYADVDDAELVERIVRKNPTYAGKVKLPPEFKLLQTTSGYANLDDLYEQAGREYNVDPNLLLEQGRQETSFKPDVMYGRTTSRNAQGKVIGARGSGQFMPGTASTFNVNVNDPRSGIRGQAEYMRRLLDMFDGDEQLALAGYNAGEGAVQKYGKKVPPYAETQKYTKIIGDAVTKARAGIQYNGLRSGSPNVVTSPVTPTIDDDKRKSRPVNIPYPEGVNPADIISPAQQPVPETPQTHEIQHQAAADPNVKTRLAVLLDEGETPDINDPKWAGFKAFTAPDGKRLMMVNLEQTKKQLKLKDPEHIQTYITKNPDKAYQNFLGIAKPVDDTSNGVAVTAETGGVENASAVVTDEKSAKKQAKNYQDQFPSADIGLKTTDEIAAKREYQRRQIQPGDKYYEFEQTGKAGDYDYLGMSGGKHYAKDAYGDEYELQLEGDKGQWKPVGTTMDRRIDELTNIASASKSGQTSADYNKSQAVLRKRYDELKVTNPNLTSDEFNTLLDTENKVKQAAETQKILAKNPAFAKYLTDNNLTYGQEAIDAYNASLPKNRGGGVTTQAVPRRTETVQPASTKETGEITFTGEDEYADDQGNPLSQARQDEIRREMARSAGTLEQAVPKGREDDVLAYRIDLPEGLNEQQADAYLRDEIERRSGVRPPKEYGIVDYQQGSTTSASVTFGTLRKLGWKDADAEFARRKAEQRIERPQVDLGLKGLPQFTTEEKTEAELREQYTQEEKDKRDPSTLAFWLGDGIKPPDWGAKELSVEDTVNERLAALPRNARGNIETQSYNAENDAPLYISDIARLGSAYYKGMIVDNFAPVLEQAGYVQGRAEEIFERNVRGNKDFVRPIKDTSLFKSAQVMRDTHEKGLPQGRGTMLEPFARGLGQVTGIILSLAATGGVGAVKGVPSITGQATKALTPLAEIAAGAEGIANAASQGNKLLNSTMLRGAIIGVNQQASEAYRRAIEKGATEDQARMAAWIAAPTGFVEGLSESKLFEKLTRIQRLDTLTGGKFSSGMMARIKNYASTAHVSGKSEFIEEALQGVGGEVAAQVYQNRDFKAFLKDVDEAVQNAAIAYPLGAVIGAGGQFAANAGQPSTKDVSPPTTQSTPPPAERVPTAATTITDAEPVYKGKDVAKAELPLVSPEQNAAKVEEAKISKAEESTNSTINGSGGGVESTEEVRRAEGKTHYEVNEQGTNATNIGIKVDPANPANSIAIVDNTTGEITRWQGHKLSEQQIAKVQEIHSNLQKPEVEVGTYDLGTATDTSLDDMGKELNESVEPAAEAEIASPPTPAITSSVPPVTSEGEAVKAARRGFARRDAVKPADVLLKDDVATLSGESLDLFHRIQKAKWKLPLTNEGRLLVNKYPELFQVYARVDKAGKKSYHIEATQRALSARIASAAEPPTRVAPPPVTEKVAAKEPWRMDTFAKPVAERGNRFEMLNDSGQVFDNLYHQSITPPKLDRAEAKAVMNRLNKSDFNNKDSGASVLKVEKNQYILEKTRQEKVEEALKEGRSVPPEILANYPDLAKKYAKPPAEQDTATDAPRDVEGLEMAAARDAESQYSYETNLPKPYHYTDKDISESVQRMSREYRENLRTEKLDWRTVINAKGAQTQKGLELNADASAVVAKAYTRNGGDFTVQEGATSVLSNEQVKQYLPTILNVFYKKYRNTILHTQHPEVTAGRQNIRLFVRQLEQAFANNTPVIVKDFILQTSDDSLAHKRKPTKEMESVVDRYADDLLTNAQYTVDGSMLQATNLETYGVMNQVLDEAFGVEHFFGRMLQPAEVTKVRKVLTDFADEMAKGNYSKEGRRGLAQFRKAFDKAAKVSKDTHGKETVIFIVDPIAIPEEQVHQETVLAAVNNDIKAMHSPKFYKQIHDSELFKNSDIKETYKGRSKEIQAIEFVHKILAGSFAELNIDPVKDADAVYEIVRDWHDDFVAVNGEFDRSQYERIFTATNYWFEKGKEISSKASERDAADETKAKEPERKRDAEKPPDEAAAKPDVGVSKIGKSIEAKAVEQGLTEGFPQTAGYDKKHVQDQIDRINALIKSDVKAVREMALGLQPVPSAISPVMLLRGMEEVAKTTKDVQLQYELANSLLVSDTSYHAQEMRMMQEREQDSATSLIQSLRRERKAKVSKWLGKRTLEEAIQAEIDKMGKATSQHTRRAKTRESWDDFIASIEC